MDKGENMTQTNDLIEKIEITSFRSIEKLVLKDIGEINVFSGINDVGKSNILKALNLFFNEQTDFLKPLKFEVDYNKISRARMIRSSKMKQLIKIRIYIKPPPSYKTLSSEKTVYLERQFDRYGTLTEKYSTDDSIKKTSITKLINKIRYIYIPALKGEDVLQFLLSLIGERELVSEKDISSLNNSIQEKTKDLTEILNASGIDIGTSFGLPTLLSEFWQKLSVDTEYEQFKKLESDIQGSDSLAPLNRDLFKVSLLNHGEGIKSKYIPPLLQWLDKNDTSKIFIWGIDEPENSLEFGLADELARLFYNDYSLRNQIFITSHSLAFINPPDNVKVKPKRYRVIKDNLGGTKCEDFNKLFKLGGTGNDLFNELGILIAQKEFIDEYRKVVSEKEQLKQKIDEYTKPLLIVEGKTDKKIIEIAWNKLNESTDLPFEIIPSGVYIDQNKSEGGADIVRKTLEFISPMIKNQIVIGLFDNDKEGNERFKGLNKDIFREYKSTSISRKHKKKEIYGLLLPKCNNRDSFVGTNPSHRYLEIEHYFSDDILKKYHLIGDTVALDSKIFHIKRKHKTKFASQLDMLEISYFENFKYLFKEIIRIIEGEDTPNT